MLPKNSVVIANTFSQQQKRWLYTWTSPNGKYQNQIDYILCSQRQRSCIQSAKQDSELTGSDHQLLIAEFRFKLKKAGKITRPVKWKFSCSVMSDSLWSHGLLLTSLHCPQDFPGKSTRVDCHFLFQKIFLTQGSNPGLLNFRRILHHLILQGSPWYRE